MIGKFYSFFTHLNKQYSYDAHKMVGRRINNDAHKMELLRLILKGKGRLLFEDEAVLDIIQD